MMDIERKAIQRQRHAWILRDSGKRYREIAQELGVSTTRAQQLVFTAERRIATALEIYNKPYDGKIAEGIWHRYTPERRICSVPQQRKLAPQIRVMKDSDAARHLSRAAATLEAAAQGLGWAA